MSDKRLSNSPLCLGFLQTRRMLQVDQSRDYTDRVLGEQVNLAIKQLPTMQATSFVIALVLSITVRNVIPLVNIIIWLLLVLVTVFSRTILYSRYSNVDGQTRLAGHWRKRYLLLALFSGCVWGLSAFIIFPVGNVWPMAIFMIAIAGLTAGTTISHAGIRLGSAAWVVPVMLLYAIRCVMVRGEFQYILGSFFVIFMVAIILQSLKNHEAITSSIALKFEHIDLLAAVRESEERFRVLARASFEAMVFSQEGIIKDCNEQLSKILGFSKEELIGKPVRDLLPPEEIERVMNNITNGRDAIIDHEVVCKDGSRRSVEAHGTTTRYLGKEYRITAIHDITERRRMEGELRVQEIKYRSLFESAKDGIFVLDETGFTDCNQTGAEMYGLTKEELIGRSPVEFAPERQSDGRLSSDVAGERIQAALGGITQVFEWQPLRADGTPFHVEITLSRLELGGKPCVQAIVRDISERKRFEQEHHKAQKLEAIGTLAGGIAHDFNNLLQGVFGYISLAKLKKDDPEKSMAALDEAEKALHLSVNLTNQLLTFSKGGKPVKKSIDLQPLVASAAKFALSGSRTDYRISALDGLWQIEADEGQISQVIQNIVLNADQAMPQGGRVEITARNVQLPAPDAPLDLQNGRYVSIAIKDIGVGIPRKYLANIFDPYFTTKEKGSGLGLATAYSIIRNHNGMIDVKSETGHGTTFVIYLPAAATVKREEQTRQVAAAGRTGRILVMDDDPVILDVSGELIRALGHSAEFSKEGTETVAKYREAQRSGRPFDIVILDLTIRGGMGGVETLRLLSEIDPGVKAVVSSGYSDDAAIAGYGELGFKAVLKKPYHVDELRDILNRLLNS
jgi:two-component system cell cycle sensor histidine kinase/response regulator CckA